jgi:hypothetical protein
VLARRLDAREAPRVRLRDAAAVLWRLHLSGERDLPWHTACALAEPVIDDPRCPLDAAHAALFRAGLRDGAGMARLVAALRVRAAAGDGPAGGVVLPLALGLRSCSAGRLADAARLLAPVQGRLSRLGGSTVQPRRLRRDARPRPCPCPRPYPRRGRAGGPFGARDRRRTRAGPGRLREG